MTEPIEQLANRVTSLEESTNKRFDAVDKRFDAVDKRFDAVDKRLDAVDKRFDALEEKVTRTIKIEHEQTRELLTKATEGFAATLARLERDATEYKQNIDARLSVHDLALKDHSARIVALERTKRAPRG